MTVQYSIQKMVSDGTLSTIALGIQYLQRNDIYMRIAGEETPQSGAPSGYTWSFINNTALKILPVVPNGVEVVVYRRTDIDAMYNIYSQNAQFDETTIDENNQQLLYIAQEYLEQGLPGAGVDTLEYVRDDGLFTYYRLRRTDGSYSEEFAVPSASSSTKVLTIESLRRSYAEANYNLVDGSFEAGGTLTSASDVLLQESSGKAFGWGGTFPKVVAAGSAVAGFVDKSQAVGQSFTTVSAIQSGVFDSGCILIVSDRDHGLFKVVSGTANGYDKISAGSGKIATLITPKSCATVKMFGAKGDGVTDDTGAMKAASAAGVQRYTDGVYAYSDKIEIISGTHVIGAGASLLALTSSAQIRIGSENVIVESLILNGNKTAFGYTSGDPFPIHVTSGAKDVTIRNNEVFNAYRVGIYCGYGETGVAPSNIHIHSNKIYDIGSNSDPIADFGNGIAVSAGYDIYIRDNVVYDIRGTGGINCEGVNHPFYNIHITGNVIKNVTHSQPKPDSARGIRVDAGSNPVVGSNGKILIKDNLVRNTAGSGIYVKDMQDYTVESNDVYGAGIHGIECVGTPNGYISIKGNTVGDYSSDGVSCVRGEFVEVSGNLIFAGRAGSRHGIRYTIQENLRTLRIDKNTIDSSVSSAIAFCGKNFSVSWNNFVNCCTTDGYAITATSQSSSLPAVERGVIDGNTVSNPVAMAAFLNCEGENFGEKITVGTNGVGTVPYVFFGAGGRKTQLIGGIYNFKPSDLNAAGGLATWNKGETILAKDPIAVGALGWICTSTSVGGVWSRYGLVTA